MPERRRLIEVAFPLDEVSKQSARDKYLRDGHISTLHIWWARRPLAACRAFIYASLVDDPGEGTEREELLKEIADLADWDAVSKPTQVVRSRGTGGSGLTGTQLLERARRRILQSNGGKAPRLLDPFAGGGAIPLEALRLGCDVEASDLNPVAVLILKGTVEYPQKFGQPNSRPVPSYIRDLTRADGQQAHFDVSDFAEAYRRNPLATDVRFWGEWILKRAKEELDGYYPLGPAGTAPVAYLWSRTVPCPSCGLQIPLLRQFTLVRRKARHLQLVPIVDQRSNPPAVSFRIEEFDGPSHDAIQGTTSAGDAACPACSQVVKGDYIRQCGTSRRLGEVMVAVVCTAPSGKGKSYRVPTEDDLSACEAAYDLLAKRIEEHNSDYPLIPDEPIAPATLGLRIYNLGFHNWGQLFNKRQALTLSVLSELTASAYREMLDRGVDQEYSKAIATYLALTVDRVAVRGCNQCIYNATGEKIENEISRGVLAPVWDYAESAPTYGASGSWANCLEGIARVIEEVSFASPFASVRMADATSGQPWTHDVVITDPPYYAAVDYAGLSDFFYVWLKRSLGFLFPELLGSPLTPKRRQAIMASEKKDETERSRYLGLMQQAFERLKSPGKDREFSIVFANADPEAWSALIEGLINAGIVPLASWPIDTEMQSGMAKAGQARLKTSVWMACKPRLEAAPDAFLGDVMADMRPVVRERLLYFWSKGIRGSDFFISAIGPALSVFGRHPKVLKPDGSSVTVRGFLDLVRREATDVALEQVLSGADLGTIDPLTRQYVTWVWSYARAPLDAGEVIALCLATGSSYDDLVRPHSIAVATRDKSKKMVRLRTIKERAAEDEDLGQETGVRVGPLIDQMQFAASLWDRNATTDLATFRGSVGETRWGVLRTLGQAVAASLPEGDEDRRLILGLLGSNVMGIAAPKTNGRSIREKAAPYRERLPGM